MKKNTSGLRLELILLLIALLFPTSSIVAHPGWGIVIDKRGQIYFSDVNRNLIWKIEKSGKVIQVAANKHSHDLWIDDAGYVYGEHIWYRQSDDTWHSSCFKISPDGRVISVSTGEKNKASGIFDFSGNEYKLVGNAHSRSSALIKISAAGQESIFAGGSWGHADGVAGEAMFRTPGVLRFGADGALYATEGGTVRRITLDGNATTLAGPRQGFEDKDGNQPRASSFLGLSIDDHGTVYAANWQKHCVIKISQDGGVTTILKSGIGWTPSGVLAARDGIYVLEHRAGVTGLAERIGLGGPRVRRIALNGSVSTIATAP